MTAFHTALFAAFALVASGCSSSNGSGSSGDASDAGNRDAGPTVTCQKDPRVDTYVANLTKVSASGGMKVTLIASEPAPPIRGTNAWTVRVADAAGNPITNATLSVLPFMPDHGHGTSVSAKATPQADGTYAIAPLYFFMPGVWRITIGLPAPDAGPTETVDFFFCVAG